MQLIKKYEENLKKIIRELPGVHIVKEFSTPNKWHEDGSVTKVAYMPVALGSLGGEGEYREYVHHVSPHHPAHIQYHEYAPPPPPPMYHPIPDPYFR